jgi:RNA polymerase sigma factor for flagellar operon FliA
MEELNMSEMAMELSMETAEKKIDVDRLWKNYHKNRNDETRNQLIEYYMPLVRYNAERVWAKLPNEVELDDLVSCGIIGLMDSIASFDLERGVKFATYCSRRIRGAILDELRERDWVPRIVRNRMRKVEEARKNLEAQLGRDPSDDELAKEMQLPAEEFKRVIGDTNHSIFISLSRPRNENDSHKDLREIDVLEDKKSQDPIIDMHKKDIKELIMRGLSRAERLIVLLYYYEEMTMKEIGATLDLSESRVSQMHSAIIKRLRSHLQNRSQEFEEELDDINGSESDLTMVDDSE